MYTCIKDLNEENDLKIYPIKCIFEFVFILN